MRGPPLVRVGHRPPRVKHRNPPPGGWGGFRDRLSGGVLLSHTLPECSTIGAVGLSFRVQYGTGRFPHAVTAVTLVPTPRTKESWTGAVNLWVTENHICGDTCGSAKTRVVRFGTV